jgi:hypothetical protein
MEECVVDYPTRAHSITIIAGADTHEQLISVLHSIIFDLRRGSKRCASGAPESGYYFEYVIDPEMTHDRYFELIDAARLNS